MRVRVSRANSAGIYELRTFKMALQGERRVQGEEEVTEEDQFGPMLISRLEVG